MAAAIRVWACEALTPVKQEGGRRPSQPNLATSLNCRYFLASVRKQASGGEWEISQVSLRAALLLSRSLVGPSVEFRTNSCVYANVRVSSEPSVLLLLSKLLPLAPPDHFHKPIRSNRSSSNNRKQQPASPAATTTTTATCCRSRRRSSLPMGSFYVCVFVSSVCGMAVVCCIST